MEALQRAKDALLTDAERVKLDDLATRIAETIAEAAQPPYRSVTREVDPFGLCAADRYADRLDAAFAA